MLIPQVSIGTLFNAFEIIVKKGATPIEELEDKVNGTVNNNKVVGFNEEC